MSTERAGSPTRDERDLRRLDYGDREGDFGRRGDHDDEHDDEQSARGPRRRRSFLDNLFDFD